MKDPLLLAVKIKKWREDPSSFFREVTGLEPYGYQLSFLDWLGDINKKKLIVVGGTAGGKSLCGAVAALWSAVVLSYDLGRPYSVAIASGGLAQAKRMYDFIMSFLSRSRHLADLVKGEPLKREVRFKNGSWVAPLPSSDTQLYNLHCPLFIIDEGAVAGDQVIDHYPRVIAGQPFGRVILLGHFLDTAECYVSKFTDIWFNEEKYPDWHRIHYSSLEIPWISESEIEAARRVHSREKFQAVFEAKLPPLTTTFFKPEDIRKARRDEPPTRSGGKIVMAVDWGFKKGFPTGILIGEIFEDPKRPEADTYQVLYAEEYSQKTPDWLEGEIKRLVERYKVQVIRADSSHFTENYRLRMQGYRDEEVVFREVKPRMQEKLRATLEQGRVSIDKAHDLLLRELIQYRLDSKKDDHLVDCLLMLVWKRAPVYPGDFFLYKTKYGKKLSG